MFANRPVNDIQELTSGPGKLTLALGIDKKLHGATVTDSDGEVSILEGESVSDMGTSRRIGVTRDLDRDLRFYMNGNRFVSR